MMLSCDTCSTNGSASWRKRSSLTCCRCCGAPSARSLPPNVGPSQNGLRLVRRALIANLPGSLTWSWRPRPWQRSISFWAGVMPESGGRTELQTRQLRWRLMLGEASADELDISLGREEQKMDGALAALYDSAEEDSADPARRSGGLGSSA